MEDRSIAENSVKTVCPGKGGDIPPGSSALGMTYPKGTYPKGTLWGRRFARGMRAKRGVMVFRSPNFAFCIYSKLLSASVHLALQNLGVFEKLHEQPTLHRAVAHTVFMIFPVCVMIARIGII